MCSECRSNPCLSRCPNAEEEKIICAICEDEITGGAYASLPGFEYICSDCLWDMTGLDLAERLGITEIM